MTSKISLVDSVDRITELMQSLGYNPSDEYPRFYGRNNTMHFVNDDTMFCLTQMGNISATYGPHDGISMTAVGFYDPVGKADSENEFLYLLRMKVEQAEQRISKHQRRERV